MAIYVETTKNMVLMMAGVVLLDVVVETVHLGVCSPVPQIPPAVRATIEFKELYGS